MKKIITKKRQIPPQKKGFKDCVNEILVLCREVFTTLKDVEELLEFISRENTRQLERRSE